MFKRFDMQVIVTEFGGKVIRLFINFVLGIVNVTG